jgi:MHS family proline/betaine transporter-like MFS transporter
VSATIISTAGERAASGRQKLVAIIASWLGWSLDLFDLFILLYVAPVVGQLFFPSSVPTLSLAAVYASFAVTLLMRPVGSALFGSYADRHGRRGAMIVAVIGVGISTALFGALPTIAQAGLAAPAIFLLLRLVQGVFVGGVVASSHTIGTESVSPRWRGVMSGFIGGGGAGMGALLASLIYLVTSTLFPGPAFAEWGWRVMFFSGILSSVLGLVIFGMLEESPYFQQLAAARDRAVHTPVRTLFSRAHRSVLLVNLLITFGGGASYYLTSGYMPTFLKVVNGASSANAALILTAASFVVVISATAVGGLSDVLGRKRTFLLVGLACLVLLPMLYLRMAAAHDFAALLGYGLAITFLGNAAYAPIVIFLNERFPTALRATGTGLSWNIGFALGGTMPTFVSLASGSAQGLPVALAAFIAAVFLLYILGAAVIPETKGRLG